MLIISIQCLVNSEHDRKLTAKVTVDVPFNNRYFLLALFEFRAVAQHCNSCQSHPRRRISVVRRI